MPNFAAAPFSPSQFAIASRVYVSSIDANNLTISLVDDYNQLGAGVALDTQNNTISVTSSSASDLPVSYMVTFQITPALISQGWSLALPFAAGIVPASNNVYFLVPASPDGSAVTIFFSNDIMGGATQEYKVNMGFRKGSNDPIWIDDPSIAFNPPD